MEKDKRLAVFDLLSASFCTIVMGVSVVLWSSREEYALSVFTLLVTLFMGISAYKRLLNVIDSW